ncbi:MULTISPECIES: hypothetical protein [Haloferacaceae]|uniref:CARDB domain-containing protein n=1 Tax=Halorubrum glutamatedens TaxID=2707018 RepID=A0ABD5QWR4_9EURY|nr:hypothetical protein [Halobellus captivus]
MAGVATVTANSPAIQVSSVAVSPDTPIVGETTTVETTISNLEQTNGTVEITDVYLRDWPTEFERAENVGSIAPGGSVTVPVTTTFDTPGEKSITVNVVVRDEEGDSHSYSYPAVVDVEEPDVDGGLSIDDDTSGEASVTLTNYGNVDFTDVEIRTVVGGEARGQQYTLDIEPDGSRTVTFDIAEYNREQVTFTANYTANGETHRVSRAITETADVRGGLSTVENSSDRMTVTLDNYGNVNFSDVEIRALIDGEVRDRRYTRDVPPDESRSTSFSTEDYDAENVTFTATYTANGETHELSRRTVLDQQVSGAISLTSVETAPGGASVSIDGEAANVGGTDVESVLLRVQNAGGVTPADGGGEYFVGSIDASEFATFELAASVENGTSTVPIEVSYLVDGERVTTVQTVEISSTGPPASPSGDGQPSGTNGQPQGPPGGSGIPTIPILIGVITLIGASGGLYYLWNRE